MYISRLSLCLVLVLICNLELGVDSNDNVPLTKLSSTTSGPVIKFYYCYSCGYKRVFHDYQGLLQKKYPEVQVTGENYNPPGYNMLLAKGLNIAKILVIILVLSRINVFQWAGHVQPFWWQWFMDNRLYSCIMVFFVCNAIEGFLISSGAFEIYFNDFPIWSKLETGKIPLPPQLIQIIDSHMQMVYPDMSDTGKMNYYM